MAIGDQHTLGLYARMLRRMLDEPGIHIGEPAPSMVGVECSTGSDATLPEMTSDTLEELAQAARNLSLTGDFWHNALLPGTWGISDVP